MQDNDFAKIESGRDGEYYASRPICYFDCANGFGIANAFRGPLGGFIKFPHSMVFIASEMTIDESGDEAASLPQWKLSAKIICEEQNIETTIILEKNISKEHAVALVDCQQEESIRLKAYDAGMCETILSSHEVIEDLNVLQKRENPFSFDDGELNESIFGSRQVFPFVMTTRQVLTNYDMYSYGDDDIDDENDIDEDDPDGDDEYIDYDDDSTEQMIKYKPMENVNVALLCDWINPDKKDLKENIRKLKKPYLFVAKYDADYNFPHDARKHGWKIFSVEGHNMTEVMEAGSLAETLWAMDNLEQSIIQPQLALDDMHKAVERNYRYHFSNWKDLSL